MSDDKTPDIFEMVEQFKREHPWYEPMMQAVRDYEAWRKANTPPPNYVIITSPTTTPISWHPCANCKGTGQVKSGRMTSGWECCPVCLGGCGGWY